MLFHTFIYYSHDVVNIHLKDKPDWFLSNTSSGQVPVLDHDGKIVVESAVCMDYLNDAFPGMYKTI